MNNVIKFTMVASVLALMGCTDNNVSGAAIEGNAVANNSSSSIMSSSSVETNLSSSYVPSYSIDFMTKPTQVLALTRGEVAVYGEEFGAEASCSAYNRGFRARFSVAHAHMFEKSMMITNFGDACDSVYNVFKKSCTSGIVVDSPEGACNNGGTFKAFCYLSKTDTVTVCSDGINCESKGPVSEAVFDSIVTEFSREAAEICDNIAVGVDTTSKQHELPSTPAVGVDTSANRSFVIKPNVETLNVSDDERAVLDSLAMAYPSKSVVSATNDLRIYSAAKYVFKTSPEKYNVGSGSTSCNVKVYAEEFGVLRTVSFSTGDYGAPSGTYGGPDRLENTILSVSDSVILYMVSGGLNSSGYKEYAETLFRTECEATAGSFYNYPSSEMFQTLQNLAMACAVKNFSGITLDAVIGQQASLCENMYGALVQPILD
jgi:hypothetical protein